MCATCINERNNFCQRCKSLDYIYKEIKLTVLDRTKNSVMLQNQKKSDKG